MHARSLLDPALVDDLVLGRVNDHDVGQRAHRAQVFDRDDRPSEEGEVGRRARAGREQEAGRCARVRAGDLEELRDHVLIAQDDRVLLPARVEASPHGREVANRDGRCGLAAVLRRADERAGGHEAGREAERLAHAVAGDNRVFDLELEFKRRDAPNGRFEVSRILQHFVGRVDQRVNLVQPQVNLAETRLALGHAHALGRPVALHAAEATAGHAAGFVDAVEGHAVGVGADRVARHAGENLARGVHRVGDRLDIVGADQEAALGANQLVQAVGLRGLRLVVGHAVVVLTADRACGALLHGHEEVAKRLERGLLVIDAHAVNGGSLGGQEAGRGRSRLRFTLGVGGHRRHEAGHLRSERVHLRLDCVGHDLSLRGFVGLDWTRPAVRVALRRILTGCL